MDLRPNAQNILDMFPRTFPVDGKLPTYCKHVTDLLWKNCCNGFWL